MLKENNVFIVKEDDANRRIDRVLRKFLSEIPLSKIYSAIRKGKIKVNGKKIKQNYLTKINDKIEIFDLSLLKNTKQPDQKFEKEIKAEMPEVLLRTNDLLFINKKAGQIVHGKNSLSELVLKYYPAKTESLSFTPGPLHRLDKDTSGIITFSQSLRGAQIFSSAIQEDKIDKYYWGIIEGTTITPVLKSNIRGKTCLTYAKILKICKEKNISLVEFKLVTGRKHQIRIQCKEAGHTLLNDEKYGSKQEGKYFLHAIRLEFSNDILNQEVFKGLPKIIEAPLPEYFKKTILLYKFL